MKNLWKSIPLIIIMLLAGCKTAQLVMKVDPTLESNASVYEVKTPDVWSDEKKLNVSFGAYRVTDMDIGWTKKRNASTSGNFWIDMLTYIPGVSAGSVDRSRDADNGETITEVSRSLSYAFRVGDDVVWNAECAHFAEEQEFKEKGYETHVIGKGHEIGKGKGHDKGKGKGHETGGHGGHDTGASRVDILSSSYTCRYTGADNEQWVLSIERLGKHSSSLDIRMTDSEKHFFAYSTAGKYVLSDGSKATPLRPPDVGYTWKDGDNNVAAISMKGSNPKVWLDKRNPDAMNDALAMASAGLLIYHRKIAPTVKATPLFR